MRLQSKRGLRSVVVTSSTKGEGKSTVALNLAFACAQLPEMNVLLVDADIAVAGCRNCLAHLRAKASMKFSCKLLNQTRPFWQRICRTFTSCPAN